MLEALTLQCKDQKESFEQAKFILIQENQYQHSDFVVVGWLLHELSNQRPVTFISFRENYAHFLSLSKKLGKSIEVYIKNKQLNYIQCFESSFCSELPLTQTTPHTYTSPPTMAKKIYAQDLINQQHILKKGQTLIVDSISFIDQNVDLIYWLYEQAMTNSCRLILGGCLEDSKIAKILQAQASLIVRLNNDVGGYGKLSIISQKQQSAVLWKNVNCKLEFSKHIAI